MVQVCGGLFFLPNMSAYSKAKSAVRQKRSGRKKSDLGKVFPSGVRVGKAAYGFGVFAFAFIPKGTAIAQVSGDLIYDPDYSSDYCIDAGEGAVLEPAPPFCYLNHACEPNCELMVYVAEEETNTKGADTEETEIIDESIYAYVGEDNDCQLDDIVEEYDEETTDESAPEVWVEAIRDIMPNEELTIDYSWPADRAAVCCCGKPQCRGWIVDPAEREQLPEPQV